MNDLVSKAYADKTLAHVVSAAKIGLAFKTQDAVRFSAIDQAVAKTLMDEPLPSIGQPINEILDTFTKWVLPYSTNFSSRHFLGFPDSGNSAAAIVGDILATFLQQNLINQKVCSPSATFVETAVLRWLRSTVGYHNYPVESAADIGGIITSGGTLSNSIAMLIARERKQPGALVNGVCDASKLKIVTPLGIGHYSVRSAQMWLGCGDHALEVRTKNYRYDLDELARVVRAHQNEIMAVIAYAGDSRTMTVDHLGEIARVVRAIRPDIWLHADACHGFSLGFSSSLKSKLRGIEDFDSVSADPHKVMLCPYAVSALLVRDPNELRSIISRSDLIMQEEFAFGQLTPFIGSKRWASLPLWFMMKNFGESGLDDLITSRHQVAVSFANKLRVCEDFVVLNEVDINSVMFLYVPDPVMGPDEIGRLNRSIYVEMLNEGRFHVHQFSIPDERAHRYGETIHPLRFMCGNPIVGDSELDELISYVRRLGQQLLPQA
jgi:L-2,4-diaminobutyrate decarboxylase